MPSNAIKTFSAGLVNRRYLGLEKAARMARWLDMVASCSEIRLHRQFLSKVAREYVCKYKDFLFIKTYKLLAA